MAKAIEEGLKEAGVEVKTVKVIDAGRSCKLRCDLVNYDAIVLSSPTYVHNLVSPMKSFLFKMEDMDLKEKSERRSVGGAVKPSR
jgi:multimeric flavodoxin WrbA